MNRSADRWIQWTTIGCVWLLALIAGTVSYLHMHALVAGMGSRAGSLGTSAGHLGGPLCRRGDYRLPGGYLRTSRGPGPITGRDPISGWTCCPADSGAWFVSW